MSLAKKITNMKTNSNTYTIVYATLLVVVVAFLLAFISQSLKSKQDTNVALDQKKQILNALNLRDLSNDEAEKKFDEVVKGKDTHYAEDTSDNHELLAADPMDGKDGIYICEVDGKEIKVIPLKGLGLWGGISGFLAVDGDKVYGAYFNHESETAGLGSKIKDDRAWQEKFIGKKLFDDEGNVALSVEKKVTNPDVEVDAVTGATLTSNGVRDMLKKGIEQYFKPQASK